ncbi:MAG: hypothetical protein RI947_1431 [Candidatus Parcubacteria bacterium]|jgi:hypothetical protein
MSPPKGRTDTPIIWLTSYLEESKPIYGLLTIIASELQPCSNGLD